MFHLTKRKGKTIAYDLCRVCDLASLLPVEFMHNMFKNIGLGQPQDQVTL